MYGRIQKPLGTSGQDNGHLSFTIEDTQLQVVKAFTYLGSTVTSTTSLDAEISSRIAKAAGVMAKLKK